MTKTEMYEERIAHLRTGLEMAAADIQTFKRMLGVPDPNYPLAIQTLLDKDVELSVEGDKLPLLHPRNLENRQ